MSLPKCKFCQDRPPLGFTFTMAFQPIVDVARGKVFAYEALVRDCDGSGADTVLSRVNDDNRYQFDQICRVTAIELASRLFPEGGGEKLSINFLPNVIYQPAACLRTSLKAAADFGFPVNRIIFELTEQEEVADTGKIKEIIAAYRAFGLKTAIDDFGDGYAGLGLLADFQPDIIKIDMKLVHHLDVDLARRAIVKGIVTTADALGIQVIAEGVETMSEYRALRDLGITLFQGYLFARPAFEALPEVTYPDLTAQDMAKAARA